MKVPSFLLRRLYVKNSLRNTEVGFEFRLKNALGSGYAYGLTAIQVDGEEIPSEQASFSVDGKALTFPEVSKETPATLAMNREAIISVDGHRLVAGAHKVTMGFRVVGLGELRFDLVDNLNEG